ncbi:MAG: hypothetical protein IPJ65_38495 [Archangiaceae bacterium]|nr:hypothetical protein [Archangiaceae bacterium]
MSPGVDEALVELSRRVHLTPGGLRYDHEELPLDKAAAVLAERVHSSFFCRRLGSAPPLPRASGDGGLVAHLASASRGAAGWEPGWRVVKAGPGWAFVSDGRLCLFLDEPGYFSPPEARVGDPVVVRVPRARENLTPNRFTLYGGAGPAVVSEPFVKLFLPLTLDGAGPLVELLSSRQVDRVPFTLFIANSPDDFERVDAAVLDLQRRDEEAVQRLLLDFVRVNRGAARTGAPLFARAVQAGLARADANGAPDAGDGFGKRRCRWLADEVWAALQSGEKSPQAWRVRVSGSFGRERVP